MEAAAAKRGMLEHAARHRNRQIKFVLGVDIHRLNHVHLIHLRPTTDPAAQGDKPVPGEYVDARVVFVYGWKILRPQQLAGWVMIDRAAMLVVEAGLMPRHREEGVTGCWEGCHKVAQSCLHRGRLKERVGGVSLKVYVCRMLFGVVKQLRRAQERETVGRRARGESKAAAASSTRRLLAGGD